MTNLHPEPHFIEWETSMSAHFRHKWAALQRGPMWSECDVKQLPTSEVSETGENDVTQSMVEKTTTQDASVPNHCGNNRL